MPCPRTRNQHHPFLCCVAGVRRSRLHQNDDQVPEQNPESRHAPPPLSGLAKKVPDHDTPPEPAPDTVERTPPGVMLPVIVPDSLPRNLPVTPPLASISMKKVPLTLTGPMPKLHVPPQVPSILPWKGLAPDWITVKFCPATVIVPCRWAPVLGDTK